MMIYGNKGFVARVAAVVAAGVALFAVTGLNGCRVSYSFSGANIDPEAKTVSIAYFPNNAPMVTPTLSAALTEALQDRFSRQTRLQVERENGDLHFEGEITNYTSTPASISADEIATSNRLTIEVRVRFTNRIQPTFNYARTFKAFQDYPSASLLPDVEPTLIPQIVEMLVEDIFNAAVAANW